MQDIYEMTWFYSFIYIQRNSVVKLSFSEFKWMAKGLKYNYYSSLDQTLVLKKKENPNEWYGHLRTHTHAGTNTYICMCIMCIHNIYSINKSLHLQLKAMKLIGILYCIFFSNKILHYGRLWYTFTYLLFQKYIVCLSS